MNKDNLHKIINDKADDWITDNESEEKRHGLGWSITIWIILILLKLVGILNLSWIIVLTAPLWMEAIVLIVIIILANTINK